jgi:tRNA threonylcarbamoyl adenosine modification protein (Sua5/YciO/YrdC/YwlC family)
VPIIPSRPTADAVAALAERLDAGGVAVLPTDTVYGIAARAADGGGIAELYRRKGRDRDVATAVLVADPAQAEVLWAGRSPGRDRLTARYWPGPLTIVDHRADDLGWDLGGDPSSLGARCPDHPLVRRLAAEVGPLAVSSANRSGDPPVVQADQVPATLGNDLLVVDGGTLRGDPSTVVDLRDGLRLLRLGGLTEAELRAAWRPPTMSGTEGK